ncbi:C6 zinc finger domain-containing protein [Dothistroma septosporum NZE10]|uniref:C6 zinc finger domain-containing protein n=1 Tax=Dothistroma septosporum (strain NZE10 / CBS 128990) TaxID=675120 RepID=M2XM81_DOTSN|nr:C6 zinc finger domain-containing protein [Dothistroma septosporum NZE10]
MPTDPFLPEGRNFPRTRSPDGAERDRKRRRKVLSCYDCRRRKLQCDRALPACGRCTKAGQAANCLYLEDAADIPLREDAHITPSSAAGRQPASYGHSSRSVGASVGATGDLLSRLEFQDGRIKQLEAALAAAGGSVKPRMPPTPDSFVGGPDPVAPIVDRETTLLRGRSFKTQFHGNTHPGALIARIPELHGFTRETFEQFPALGRIKEDMSSLESRTNCAGVKHGAVADDALKALLPSKDEADALIETYLDSFGALYHIIHLPSFWEEYNNMWSDVQATKAHFVALVLVMMSAAQCLTTAKPWLYRANSSTAREKAIAMIAAVDDWLMEQSQKHVEALDFQVRVLLQLAKQVVGRKFKRTWTDMGHVVRFCMAAGLHRTPDLIRKPTSLLDKELRKRVWAAATELELQAAFDRGMVSSPWPAQSDCPAPTYIADDDLDQETPHMPALRRADDFTQVSYLCLSSESIMLRQSLNTYLNNIRQRVHFDESKHYTEEIESCLQTLPEWIGTSSQIAHTMLSLNLRQYLLVLHDRQLRIAESKAERDFSRMILVETATKMLEQHQALTNKGIYALELLCYDQLRAALSLCHIASLNPQADDALSRVVDDSTNRLVPAAIEMLTDKVIRFGREQRQLWILLAANGFMKSKKTPSKRLVYMQEAVDKITRPYYKIMACQEDAPVKTPAAGTGAERNGEVLPGISDYYANANTRAAATTGSANECSATDTAPLLDLDEIAAWTFEDWSFDPADLAAAFPEGTYANTGTTPYPSGAPYPPT